MCRLFVLDQERRLKMENEELVHLIQNGENVKDNMEQLYIQNRGFIYKEAQKYASYVDVDDLMQESYFALKKAVDSFDSGQDVLFLTYFGYWLQSVLGRYVDNTQRTIRVPVYLSRQIRKYEGFIGKCESEGRDVSDQEICEALKITLEQLEDLRQVEKNVNCGNLDGIIPGTESLTLADITPAPGNMEEDVINNILNQRLWEIVDNLGDGHKYAVLGKFRDSRKQVDMAKERGCSKQRIQQLEKRALEILRQQQELQEMVDYSVESMESKAYRGGIGAYRNHGDSVVEHLSMKQIEQNKKIEKKRKKIETLLEE